MASPHVSSIYSQKYINISLDIHVATANKFIYSCITTSNHKNLYGAYKQLLDSKWQWWLFSSVSHKSLINKLLGIIIYTRVHNILYTRIASQYIFYNIADLYP